MCYWSSLVGELFVSEMQLLATEERTWEQERNVKRNV